MSPALTARTTPPKADLRGLSAAEVRSRQQLEGYNELPTRGPSSLPRLVIHVVREPMLALLLAVGVVYVFLGDLREAVALLVASLLMLTITLVQEYRTDRTLFALRNLASPRALVLRDGEQVRIAAREVVRGDVVLIAEGDRVPADGALLAAVNLSADESLLTGESLSVSKSADSPGEQRLLFASTLVTQGYGSFEVTAIGAGTRVGAIGASTAAIAPERTPLQREIGRWVTVLAILGLLSCAVLMLAYVLLGRGWLNGVLAGLTLAISMIPEELPVILTVFFALGAWRIAQRRVLARRIAAIEALGAATVLCVDKTGTLTMNRMSVARLFVSGQQADVSGGAEVPEGFHDLAKSMFLASRENVADPMEVAFREFSSGFAPGVPSDLSAAREYPLTSAVPAMSRAWGSRLDRYQVAAKGAPEVIARFCRLDAVATESVLRAVRSMAGNGLRVLGVAAGEHNGELPASQQEFVFRFAGLVGVADPVRGGVPEAVRSAHEAGIRVVIVTGDHLATAQDVARQAGLADRERALTGQDIARMSDAELKDAAASTVIFSRITPEQKLRILRALQAAGEVVGMTGDGVNDAPALKAADAGIAMGARGTDVAREAAALVLLDDNFASIIAAIALGRQIYANIRKAITYALAIHVPIMGLALLPVLLQWPTLLLPLHIVLLELVIDPACAIAFEAEPADPSSMRRPPRSARAKLLDRRRAGLAFLEGGGVLAVLLVAYGICLGEGYPVAEARTLVFVALIVANLALIWTNRSSRRTIPQLLASANRPLWYVTAGALLTVVLLLSVPLLRELFGFTGWSWEVGVAVLAGANTVFWFELLKLFRPRHPASTMPA
ncbi:MAG: cation-translocating P-type ATPase [Candidatus Koribacter versatilis]|uniref:Cation-translocating P-type ATPase n=1 Tax=Candidatus Korobacter versatilis TaxID=658062 RepID=A0A932A6P8_9BACT|nr:cation-translocating P-type ATPase [Candidatus Koribacter versatilis]